MGALPILAVEHSRNSKLSLNGSVSTTWASRKSCPPCALYDVCYGAKGNARIHTTNIGNSRVTDPVTIAKIEASAIVNDLTGEHDLRIHSVGDWASEEAILIGAAAGEVYKEKHGKKVWTYTHSKTDRKSWGGVSVLRSLEAITSDAKATDESWDAGLAGAVKAAQEGWASALVVKRFEKDTAYPLVTSKGQSTGLKGVPCPQQTKKADSCVSCRLCFDDSKLRKAGLVILFQKH